jgi:hypothetical protein
VHADDELVAEAAGLQRGAGVAWPALDPLSDTRGEDRPWWAKSKQPSIQMRLSEMGTSS